MSNVKILDLTDIAEQIWRIKVNINEKERVFDIKDPTFAVMVATETSREALKDYRGGDKKTPDQVRKIHVTLVHAILSQGHDISMDEVSAIPFPALLKISNMMTKQVDNSFLEEGYHSKQVKKGKSSKKAKTTS